MSRSPYDVILRPVISEKSMTAAQYKKYTFQVATDAGKTEIRHAVEEIFGVQVKKVNVMNYRGKLKRQGRTIGRRSATKKAIVSLAEGSKTIEFFESL
ncbi:MAG: 50S ribosomal protein L23 [Clostridiales Family XIII bacterium]|jgi:large subunit ribosomal protein L23|nr:50S ribosomal protein L23 [Clostridiales Family XIII bacterium]